MNPTSAHMLLARALARCNDEQSAYVIKHLPMWLQGAERVARVSDDTERAVGNILAAIKWVKP